MNKAYANTTDHSVTIDKHGRTLGGGERATLRPSEEVERAKGFGQLIEVDEAPDFLYGPDPDEEKQEPAEEPGDDTNAGSSSNEPEEGTIEPAKQTSRKQRSA